MAPGLETPAVKLELEGPRLPCRAGAASWLGSGSGTLSSQVGQQRDPLVEEPVRPDKPGQRRQEVVDLVEDRFGELGYEGPEVERDVGEDHLWRRDVQRLARLPVEGEVEQDLGGDRGQDVAEVAA